ncbi:MAG: hypothetical protein HYU66_21620 [Armatimonadetes bacterium]|nr:hypothetical protein [Armatimonadota bacterium]
MEALLSQLALLLPLGMVLFLGAWCFLAPYLLRSAGQDAVSGAERLLAFGGRWRWFVVPGGLLVMLLALAGLRQPGCRAALRRGGFATQSLVKLAAFLPLMGALVTVLMSVLVPLLRALSTVRSP